MDSNESTKEGAPPLAEKGGEKDDSGSQQAAQGQDLQDPVDESPAGAQGIPANSPSATQIASEASARRRRRRRKRRGKKPPAGSKDPVTPRALRGRPEWNSTPAAASATEEYQMTLSQRVTRRRNLQRHRLAQKKRRGAHKRKGAGAADAHSHQGEEGATSSHDATAASSVDAASDSIITDLNSLVVSDGTPSGRHRASVGTLSTLSDPQHDVSLPVSPGPQLQDVTDGVHTAVQTDTPGTRRRRRRRRTKRGSGHHGARPSTVASGRPSLSTASFYGPYAASLRALGTDGGRSSKHSGTRRPSSLPSTPIRRVRSVPAHLTFSPHHHYDGALRRKRPPLASTQALSEAIRRRRPREIFQKSGAVFSSYSLSKFKSAPAFSMGGKLKSRREIAIDCGFPEPPGPDVYDTAKSFSATARSPPAVAFGSKGWTPDPAKSPRPGPGGTYQIESFVEVNMREQKGPVVAGRLKTRREIAIACGFPTTPAPGGNVKVPSFVNDNKHHNKGVQFGHRLKSDMDRALAREDFTPGPGGTSPVVSFAEANIQHNRGARFGHRLPSKREILRAIGFPEPPAPGGNCKVPSFVDDNKRENKGVVFGSKWVDVNELRARRGYLHGPGPDRYDVMPPPLQRLPRRVDRSSRPTTAET